MTDLELAQQEIRRLRGVVHNYENAIDVAIQHLINFEQDNDRMQPHDALIHLQRVKEKD